LKLRLAVPKTQIRLLATLRDLTQEQLSSVRAALEALGSTLEITAFELAIAKVLDDDGVAKQTAAALLLLSKVRRSYSADAVAVLEAISADIALRGDQYRWSAEEVASWKRLAPSIAAVVALSTVSVLEKSVELAYSFRSLYRSARVLTDIRPVFNDDGSEVHAAVVTHTLELAYTEDGVTKTLCLAVDAQDLTQLSTICSRAQQKAKAARALMSAGVKVPTSIAGDIESEDD